MECALPRHDAVGLDVSLAVSHNHKHNGPSTFSHIKENLVAIVKKMN